MSVIREAFSAAGQELVLAVPSTAGRIGIGVTGTFVGTLSFFYTQDGATYFPLSVTPWPSGTTVQTATTTGTWFTNNLSFTAIKVVFTAKTSGTPIVAMAAAADGSFQDAFLTEAQLFPTSAASSATNTLTQAARTNTSWRLKEVLVSCDATATWATSPALTIKDGSTTIWAMDLATTTGQQTVALPPDGLTNTPGNSMVLALVSSGGHTNINAAFSVA